MTARGYSPKQDAENTRKAFKTALYYTGGMRYLGLYLIHRSNPSLRYPHYCPMSVLEVTSLHRQTRSPA